MAIQEMEFEEFASLYCSRQVQTAEGLRATLAQIVLRYPDCTGFMMLECQQMDSSRMGELTILVYGPSNTWKDLPAHPVSPRGLASDMAVVIATLAREKV